MADPRINKGFDESLHILMTSRIFLFLLFQGYTFLLPTFCINFLCEHSIKNSKEFSCKAVVSTYNNDVDDLELLEFLGNDVGEVLLVPVDVLVELQQVLNFCDFETGVEILE